MTAKLRLESTPNFDTLVDFYDSVLKVEEDWVPATGDPEGSPIADVIPFLAVSQMEDAVKNMLKNVDLALQAASRHQKDILVPESVVLRVETTAGTVRRTPVLGGFMSQVKWTGNSVFMEEDRTRYQLNIQRAPYWEYPLIADTEDDMSGLGGTHLMSSPGTMDARIGYLTLTPGAGTADLAKYWFGIRPTYAGTTDFNPKIEAEAGTNIASTDTSDVADGGASGGTKVQITFATQASLIERFYILISNTGAAEPRHYIGRYLVLARVKATAASSRIGLQLQTGYRYQPFYNPLPEVEITDTAWRMVPLGHVQIPPVPAASLYTTDDPSNFKLSFFAERYSGTAFLDIDAIVLVPASHMFYAEKTVNGVGSLHARYRTRPNGQPFAWGAMSLGGAVDTGAIVSYENLVLPVPGVAKAVVVTEGESGHVLTDLVDLSYHYFPRARSIPASEIGY